MPKSYTHLTQEQRCHISILLKRNFSQKYIAQEIDTSPATLSRELRRNGNKDGSYTHNTANQRAKARKKVSASNPKKFTKQLTSYVIQKLEMGWSPDQISGRLWLDLKVKISRTAIYNWIKKDREEGGKLYLRLRHKGRKRRCYNRKKAGRSLIPNRVDIILIP
jgi:IS30 family transposase